MAVQQTFAFLADESAGSGVTSTTKESVPFGHLHRAAGEVGDAAAGPPKEDSGREGAFSDPADHIRPSPAAETATSPASGRGDQRETLAKTHLQNCTTSCAVEVTKRHDLQAGEVTSAEVTRASSRDSVLQQLRRQAGCLSTLPTDAAKVMSTGSETLDRHLPRGGLRTDAINEWIGASHSSGATVLATIATATYLRPNSNNVSKPYAFDSNASGPLVIVDRDGTFYPPAAVALGIPAEKMVLVRPKNHADHVWAIDQALRCESVAGVWSHIGPQLNDRDARRFQLAAESGQTPGFLIRPSSVRGRPTFADVRLYCEPMAPARPAAEDSRGPCRGNACPFDTRDWRRRLTRSSICAKPDARSHATSGHHRSLPRRCDWAKCSSANR